MSGIETRFTRDERNDDSIPDDKVIDEFEVFLWKVRPLKASIYECYHRKKNASYIGTF